MRCQSEECRITHALIPSFSVPCFSTGLQEMDQFITMRMNGATVSEAGQCFIDAGMSPDYPEFIHKRFKRTTATISTVFNSPQLPSESYPQVLYSLCKPEPSCPVTEINRLCHPMGYNPVCFSRSNILLLPKFKGQPTFSHNPPSRPPP